MPILALLGLILIVLAIIHIIPLILGLVLGIALLAVGGGGFYNGHRGGTW